MGWVLKIDKNNKAKSPEIKVMGLFCFKWEEENAVDVEIVDYH
jgi:hypothetical protein